MKNTVASAAVARERKFAEPVAPNRLEDEPPPNPEPMSAPLPCWSSTRPMMPSAVSTCTTMITFVQNPIRLSFPRSGPHDGEEILRHQRCAAYQPAIHVRHRKNRRRIVRLHTAAIEDRRALEDPLADQRVHRLRLFRRRRAARADRPDRLVSHHRPGKRLDSRRRQHFIQLPRHYFLRLPRI